MDDVDAPLTPVDPSRDVSWEPNRTRGASSDPPLSPRRRRLRQTIGVLIAVGLVGFAAGLVAYYRGGPEQYRPDEKLADITSSLARNLPKGAPKPAFTDVTRQAGLASFRTFAGARTSQLPEDMGAGVAWGDFNNDGFDDVFLVSAGGPLNAPDDKLAPCELYENLGNGTFVSDGANLTQNCRSEKDPPPLSSCSGRGYLVFDP